MTAAFQPRTNGPAHRGQSRFFASPPRAPRCRHARPAKRRAGRKTAPGIFFAAAPKPCPEAATQSIGTHQESATYVFVFVPGCAVAPNSAEDKSLSQGGVQPVYGANGKQIGSVTVVTYVATAHGLQIVLGYTDSSSGLSNFNWVQTIRTNQPLGGATSPYNDPQPPDDNLPFYWTNAELPSYTNTNGYNVVFVDGPQRPGNATWQGELSVVGMNGQGGYQALQTFTYGFDINNGKVTLQSLQPSSPSAFQLKSIPGPP